MPRKARQTKKPINMKVMQRIYELGEDIAVLNYHINKAKVLSKRIALVRLKDLLANTIIALEDI